MATTIGEALTSIEFLTGLRNGAVALAIALIFVVVWRRSAPVAGVLWAGAAGAGLWMIRDVPHVVLLGFGLLVLAGLVDRFLGSLSWLRPLAALPGAWLVARESSLEGAEWIPWVVLGAVVVGGPLMASAERWIEPFGVGILVWVVSVGGVYGTVPDTEEALVLLGAVAPLVVLGIFNLTRFGAAGAYPAVGVLAWVAATGGVGRPASIVGALGCIGVFLVAPLAQRIRGKALESWPIVLVTDILVVAIASRVAGLRTSVTEALVLVAIGLLLGLVVLVVAGEVRARRVTAPDSGAVSS